MPYFNYRVHLVPAAEASYWQRREFLHAWWAIYAGDRHWTPPAFGQLARELQPRHNPHLARLQPILVYVDALQRTGLRTARQDQPVPLSNILERTLAAAVALYDPRRRDKTAYLALLQTANDHEALERLLDAVGEVMRVRGAQHIILPTGLSPYLGSGIQTDAWNVPPPLGAPTNPPYVPDLLADLTRPQQQGALFLASVPPNPAPAGGPASLHPLDARRLTGDLLPLWAAAGAADAPSFPGPDEAEAAFMLRWLGEHALDGWLAKQAGQPVGFVLVGPDPSRTLRRTGGGRRAHRRAWLLAETRLKAPRTGRLYFGGVADSHRGQGIGRQLWQAALATARANAWRELAVGPVWTDAGAQFLRRQGASQLHGTALLTMAL